MWLPESQFILNNGRLSVKTVKQWGFGFETISCPQGKSKKGLTIKYTINRAIDYHIIIYNWKGKLKYKYILDLLCFINKISEVWSLGKKHQTVDSSSQNGGVQWALGFFLVFSLTPRFWGSKSLNICDNEKPKRIGKWKQTPQKYVE